MAKTTSPLTNTEVKQAKAREKEYNLADGHGLCLRVKPIGSKIWLFNYSRPYTKKRANLSLGSYPDLSLPVARLTGLLVSPFLIGETISIQLNLYGMYWCIGLFDVALGLHGFSLADHATFANAFKLD